MSRKAKDRFPANISQDGGLPGLHRNAVHEHLALFADDLIGIVLYANGTSSGYKNQVALGKCLFQGSIKERMSTGEFPKDTLERLTLDVGYKVFVARNDGLDASALRHAWDMIRARLGEESACVIACNNNGVPLLMAAGTDAAVAAGFNAGAIIKAISKHIKGGGGGKPTMAQAGGKDVGGLDAALDAAREILQK